MFRLEMLPACEGDCLVLSWGEPPYRMLVDGGRAPTADDVLAYAKDMGFPKGLFELFVVTHIDRDHIEGAVALMSDERFPPLVKKIWFNDRGDLDYAPPASKFEQFGALDGERLTRLIADHKTPSNPDFAPAPAALTGDTLPEIELEGGLTITLLSPDLDQLAALVDPWDDTLADATPGREEFGEAEPIDVNFLANKKFKPDRSKPNGSSIAMIAKYAGHYVLLGGDAHVGRLLKSIEIYRAMHPEFQGFDLVKAPHHGSHGNMSIELAEALRCSNWAISTNGSQFKHPDREAIARMIALSPGPARLYFNYDNVFTGFWRGSPVQNYQFRAEYGVKGYIAIDVM